MASEVDSQDSSGDELARHPGRPFPAGAIDPELLSLRRPRTPIGPLLAASIVVFCAYILWILRDDLRFSQQPETPREVTLAAVITGDVGDETFVQIEAPIDRSVAVRVSKNTGDLGHRLAPVQGSGGRLWVMTEGSAWRSSIAYDELYTGRLRRFDDVTFADDVRRHLRARGLTPRFVTPSAVQKALESKASEVVEPGGEVVAVTAETPVLVAETRRDRSEVHVIATARFTSVEAWRRALRAAGIEPAAPPKVRDDEDRELVWIFEVAAAPEELRRALVAARLYSAYVEPIVVRHRIAWSEAASGSRGAAGGRAHHSVE